MALPLEYQWDYDNFLLIEYGEMMLCIFLRPSYSRPESFYLTMQILPLVCSLLKSNVHTVRNSSHMESPNVGALIKCQLSSGVGLILA